MGSNRENSNIAIVILENLQFSNGNKNYYRILMVAIIFSPTVQRMIFLLTYSKIQTQSFVRKSLALASWIYTIVYLNIFCCWNLTVSKQKYSVTLLMGEGSILTPLLSLDIVILKRKLTSNIPLFILMPLKCPFLQNLPNSFIKS